MVLQPGQIDLAIGPDGNTEIFDTPEGLVVVDTGRHPAHAQAILDHARKLHRPIIAVVNTHWHLDHTTGNRDIFAAYPKARLVATRAAGGALDGFLAASRKQAIAVLADPATPPAVLARTQRALLAMDDRKAMVPAHPVSKDGPLALGGRRFEVHIAKAAATEADLWLLVPDENLAVVGDLVVAPVPFFDTGCENGWADALEAIDKAPWEHLVPGHGAIMNRADFARWRIAFNAYVDCANSQRDPDECAANWMRDAQGFYAAGEADSVRKLAVYYVAEVLRAPARRRMTYCVGHA